MLVDGDCDDQDETVNPDAEYDPPYDGVDQDCAGNSDYDVDGHGHDLEPVGDDCRDEAPLVFGARCDNVLVGHGNHILEFDSAGSLVRKWPVALPSLNTASPSVRGVVIDRYGRFHVLFSNMLFEDKGHLSTFDEASGAWAHRTFDDFVSLQPAWVGGLATDGDRVWSVNKGAGAGLVEFDGESVLRVVASGNFNNVTWHDGLLYVLGWGEITVYDTDSYYPVTTIDLPSRNTYGIALDHRGLIWSTNGFRDLVAYDRAGEEVNRIFVDVAGGMGDIDLSATGQISVGTSFDEFVLNDAFQTSPPDVFPLSVPGSWSYVDLFRP